ncbi:MAG: hypothetical protein M1837_001566 [Sclerophora amabilis]|nr:MAG: hypothetical protein M1837_001566 [Sclerophora amabilis]
MLPNVTFGLFASAIAQWSTLSSRMSSYMNPLLIINNNPDPSSPPPPPPVTISHEWDVLGPFQIGTREAAWGADPLERLGGFRALRWDSVAEFPSSLARNGTVGWSRFVLDDDDDGPSFTDTGARAALTVRFPPDVVDWAGLRSVYGWAAWQYQAWARGTVSVNAGTGRRRRTLAVAFHLEHVLEFWIDGVPYFGGDFYADRRAPLVLHLRPGPHEIEIRLIRDVRAMGGGEGGEGGEPSIQIRIEAQVSPGALAVAEDKWIVPDIVDGKLPSNLGSVAIRNDHLAWIDIWHVSSTDDSFDVSLLASAPLRLAPGQSRPLLFSLFLHAPEASRLSLKIEYTIGDIEEQRRTVVNACTLKRSSQVDPHKFTFFHPSGIVSYAILKPPPHNATCSSNEHNKVPILLNLHGAGLEADSPLVAHSLDLLPDLCCWIVFPTGVTPWSGDDWHNWGFADLEAAISAIPSWIENVGWSGLAADLDRWLVSGHSNGGQGTWYALTHRPDKIIAAAPVSGYLSINGSVLAFPMGFSGRRLMRRAAYVPNVLWSEDDPLVARVLQTAQNDVKHELLAENVAGIPIFQQHGSKDDNVPVYHSRRMHELIFQTGWHSEYSEIQGAGHWFDGVMTTDRLTAFYKEHVDQVATLPKTPDRFTIVVANPGMMGSKGGIVVDQLLSPDQYGRIEVVVHAAPSVWELRTSNIRRFHLEDSHPSQGRGSSLLIDGERAALQIEAFDHGNSWFVQSDDGFWEWSSDARWQSLTQRFGGQSGALDAFLNSKGRFILTSTGADTARVAVDISRNLYQYFAADAEIREPPSTTKITHTDQTDRDAGNVLHVIIGSHGMQQHQCHPQQEDVSLCFLVQEEGEEGSERVRGFHILDSVGRSRFCPTGPGSGAIFLRPMAGERVELVVWGYDRDGVARAARLLPSLSGTGQPDFVITEPAARSRGRGGLAAAGFFDYAWRTSAASYISCRFSPSPLAR